MIRTWPERDPNYRVIKTPDVTNRDCWPKAPSKYVFIFEAINLAGSALFAGDWTGKELAAVHWNQSPRDERVQEHLPKPIGGGAGGSHSFQSQRAKPIKFYNFHVQDWCAEQRQPLWEENGRALKRLEQAIEWLAQRCRDGDLKSHYRLRSGGSKLVPMQSADWNVESPLYHFVTYGGKRRHVGTQKKAGFIETFVFFEGQELLGALEQEPAAQLVVREADLSRLSPYLQLAVRVALERGYFERGSCETMDVREAEIARAWPHFMPDIAPVDSTVKQIAKLITFPDPTAIKQGQRGARSRKTAGTLKV